MPGRFGQLPERHADRRTERGRVEHAVDEHVEATLLGAHPVDELADRAVVVVVALHRHRHAARPARSRMRWRPAIRSRRQPARACARSGTPSPRRTRAPRDALADPPARAGHDRHPPRQRHPATYVDRCPRLKEGRPLRELDPRRPAANARWCLTDPAVLSVPDTWRGANGWSVLRCPAPSVSGAAPGTSERSTAPRHPGQGNPGGVDRPDRTYPRTGPHDARFTPPAAANRTGAGRGARPPRRRRRLPRGRPAAAARRAQPAQRPPPPRRRLPDRLLGRPDLRRPGAVPPAGRGRALPRLGDAAVRAGQPERGDDGPPPRDPLAAAQPGSGAGRRRRRGSRAAPAPRAGGHRDRADRHPARSHDRSRRAADRARPPGLPP